MASPRPTVAEVRELEGRNHALRSELATCAKDLEDTTERLRSATRSRDDLEAQLKVARTGEAGALDACMQALDDFRSHLSNRPFSGTEMHYIVADEHVPPTPDIAHEVYADPIGRILLHLAARYRVALVPDPALRPDSLAARHG